MCQMDSNVDTGQGGTSCGHVGQVGPLHAGVNGGGVAKNCVQLDVSALSQNWPERRSLRGGHGREDGGPAGHGELQHDGARGGGVRSKCVLDDITTGNLGRQGVCHIFREQVYVMEKMGSRTN